MKLVVLFLPVISLFTCPVAAAPSRNETTGVVWHDIEYIQVEASPMRSKSLNKRQIGVGIFREPLTNFLTYYTMNVTIGSPLQSLSVLIDTGSSDLWVPGAKYEGFDHTRSSTWIKTDDKFSIKYVKGFAKGMWGKDTVDFSSGASITNQQFGVATDSSDPTMGVFGIGPVNSEASTTLYNNIPVSLVKQGLIAKNIYSVYLDDQESQTGHVLFGGIDQEKFVPPLQTVPVTSTSTLEVTLGSVRAGKEKNISPVSVVFDTGTSLMYLPKNYVDTIARAYRAKYNEKLDMYTVNKSAYDTSPESVKFNFQGAVIEVPTKEILWPLTWFTGKDDGGAYALTVMPNSQSLGFNILGDTFLRSAYVVYDLDYREISIAPIRYTQESDVIAITDTLPEYYSDDDN